MNKRGKPIRFKSAEAEEAFWSKADSVDYIRPGSVRRARFPDLRLTSRTVPLRLPVVLLDRIKVLAHKQDIPYQSLIKTWLVRDANEAYHTEVRRT